MLLLAPSEDDDRDLTDIVNITFVDDERATLVAKSPIVFRHAIDTLLQILVSAFRLRHLELSFEPRKTKAVL